MLVLRSLEGEAVDVYDKKRSLFFSSSFEMSFFSLACLSIGLREF